MIAYRSVYQFRDRKSQVISGVAWLFSFLKIRIMKWLLIILLTSFCCPPHTVLMEKWLIEKESNLYFEGKTNVSSFRCGIASYLRPDTLYFYRDDISKPVLTVKGGLTININYLGCKETYMHNDLRKSLKAGECPLMTIALLNIGNFTGNTKNVKGRVAINLAGVTRLMEVDYTIQAIDVNNLRLH